MIGCKGRRPHGSRGGAFFLLPLREKVPEGRMRGFFLGCLAYPNAAPLTLTFR